MSNQVSVFNFEDSNVRIVKDENNELWFVAKDVCTILGYSNVSQTINDNCKEAGISKRYISSESGAKQTIFINEGNLYRLVIKSNKPESERFESWVCDDVLPTIRKTGGYSTTAQKDKLELDLIFADAVAKTLRLSNSSTLSVLGKIEKQYNLTPMLPAYAVDAPTGDTTDSSKPTKSATELLKDSEYEISVRAFNKIALADNWLEKLTRQSSKGTKEFLSITEKGLQYGKNVISPSNPRETNPHWYMDSFKEFADLILKGN